MAAIHSDEFKRDAGVVGGLRREGRGIPRGRRARTGAGGGELCGGVCCVCPSGAVRDAKGRDKMKVAGPGAPFRCQVVRAE
jgi:hypothetical protein